MPGIRYGYIKMDDVAGIPCIARDLDILMINFPIVTGIDQQEDSNKSGEKQVFHITGVFDGLCSFFSGFQEAYLQNVKGFPHPQADGNQE